MKQFQGHYTVYIVRDANGDALYVGCSGRVINRLWTHCRYRDWARDIATVECEHYDDKREALTREARLIHELEPAHNCPVDADLKQQRVRERHQWPVHAFPEVVVYEDAETERIVVEPNNFVPDGVNAVRSKAKRHPMFARVSPTGKVHALASVWIWWENGRGKVRAHTVCGRGAAEPAERPEQSDLCVMCARHPFALPEKPEAA